jgi:hypothetical protein
MNKFSMLSMVALIAATLACQAVLPNQPSADFPDLGCRETIAGIDELQGNLEFPQHFWEENPAKQGGEFDPNRYFEVFTHLSMQDGYVLDYVYHQDGFGGFPVFYARPVDQPPYATEAEYQAASPDSSHYLSFVLPQESPEGYFEYAALSTLAGQFYLDWHANYSDWQVLCGKADVDEIIQLFEGEDSFDAPMTATQKRQARAIKNPQPSVELTDETAIVTMLLFTKWGGFYLREFTINRADHSILDVQDTQLVEYECGVLF